jgi:translation elongation factor EF-Ts
MAGRIEAYLHSDKSVPNKGGALVSAVCTTDFAARTDVFIDFVKLVAKMAFAAGASNWDEIVDMFPEIQDRCKAVSAEIREPVTFDRIVVMVV